MEVTNSADKTLAHETKNAAASHTYEKNEITQRDELTMEDNKEMRVQQETILRVCAWCKRRTLNGKPYGDRMNRFDPRYAAASHGLCVLCAENFDRGAVREAKR